MLQNTPRMEDWFLTPSTSFDDIRIGGLRTLLETGHLAWQTDKCSSELSQRYDNGITVYPMTMMGFLMEKIELVGECTKITWILWVW